MSSRESHSSLFPQLNQYEVDFVIPRTGIDIPIGIDPFLLYKSRDTTFRKLHSQLLAAFNAGVAEIRARHLTRAGELFDYPEVSSIGFGYARGSKHGSGVGVYLASLIIETLQHSPSLQERGVRHVEEMQLLSAGIGPDRVSDITANVLKAYLIEYTRRQSEIWSLKVVSAPVEHVYDHETNQWFDGYFDLPVSPIDGSAVLFVPRRIVRLLPWINYPDFLKGEFRAYLNAKRHTARQQESLGVIRYDQSDTTEAKKTVTGVTRNDISLVDRYVRAKESAAAEAQPDLSYLGKQECPEADRLKQTLRETPVGAAAAGDYQKLVLEILNFLFNPELIDGRPEVRTVEGTERRDIVFTNDSDESFWDYVRKEHGSFLLMFEAKNSGKLDTDAINQTATYLGDRLGRLGVIVTRNDVSQAMHRKAFSVWNDSGSARKVILFLTDTSLNELLDIRCRDGSTTRWMQRHYRRFRETVQ